MGSASRCGEGMQHFRLDSTTGFQSLTGSFSILEILPDEHGEVQQAAERRNFWIITDPNRRNA